MSLVTELHDATNLDNLTFEENNNRSTPRIRIIKKLVTVSRPPLLKINILCGQVIIGILKAGIAHCFRLKNASHTPF
jgi:hypothetical protein